MKKKVDEELVQRQKELEGLKKRLIEMKKSRRDICWIIILYTTDTESHS